MYSIFFSVSQNNNDNNNKEANIVTHGRLVSMWSYCHLLQTLGKLLASPLKVESRLRRTSEPETGFVLESCSSRVASDLHPKILLMVN